MANVLLTVLGANGYSECDYFYRDTQEVTRTKYVQEALIKLLAKGWSKEKGDKVIILLTDIARKNNYNTTDEKEIKLDKILESCNLDVEDVSIKEGKNDNELRQIFDQIYQHTQSGDHVIIDITHSLRNIPIQALVALNYAKVIKGVTIDGIYYGAFELGVNQEETKTITSEPCKCGKGTQEKITYVRKVEILNLNMYVDLLDWTHAINTFLKTGTAHEIKALWKEYNKKVNINGQHKSNNELKQVVDGIDSFTRCITNSRGMMPRKNGAKVKKLELRSIQVAAKKLNQALDNFKASSKEYIPLTPLFNLVEEKIQPFLEEDHVKVGLATVDWCITYNQIQQGYTALEETLTTHACCLLQEDEQNIDSRKELSAALALMSREQDKEKEIEEKIKVYINQLGQINPEMGKLADQIKQCRNDINHFGFQKDSSRDCKKLEGNLKTLYKKAKALIPDK